MSKRVSTLVLKFSHGMNSDTMKKIKDECSKRFKGIEGPENIEDLPSYLYSQVERVRCREGDNAKYVVSIYIDSVLYFELIMEGNWWNRCFRTQKKIVIRNYDYEKNKPPEKSAPNKSAETVKFLAILVIKPLGEEIMSFICGALKNKLLAP